MVFKVFMVMADKTTKLPSSMQFDVMMPDDPKLEGVTSAGNPVIAMPVVLEVPCGEPPVLLIKANSSAFARSGLYLVQRIVKDGSTENPV
jgi:hypothetical protein